jgi:hypothetical protein
MTTREAVNLLTSGTRGIVTWIDYRANESGIA